jgi:TolB-like protein
MALSSGPDDEYFADGLTEEILNSLAQLPELLVTARTSSFHFKGQDIPIQEIAATLGVSNIVEGSVRRSGERLRVTAQLIRAQDGFHLWSEEYDSTSTDSIAVQEMIAEKIAQAMNVVMDDKKRASMKNSGLRDGETFIAFQKGQELYDSAHGESEQISALRHANRYLEVVMERAPDYPPAYRLHSDLYVHILMDHATNRALQGVTEHEIADAVSHVTSDYQTAIKHARSFEERNNLEFDYAILTSDWGGMSGRLETFLSEDGCIEPNWSGIFLNPYSYASRARARQKELRQCDPFRVDSWEEEVETAMWAGDAPAAIDLAREGLLIVPGKKLTTALILALLADGRYDDVETALADPVLSPELVFEFTFRLAAARGDREVAQRGGEEWLEFFTKDGNGDYQLLLFSAMMGDLQNANRVAAQFDQNHFGSLALLEAVVECVCGAPWELSATPAFAARFRESGFSWPPVSPIKFPLKNW